MKITLEKKTIYIFFIAAFALVSIIIAFFFSTQKIKSTSNWVEHTEKVLSKSDKVLMDILNIETGSRGYIITRNELYLKPYQIALATINRNLSELAVLTIDNPQQQTRIDLLKKIIEEKLSYSEVTIEDIKENRLTNAQKMAANEKGKNLTDEIRSTITDINLEEFKLLKQRKIDFENSGKNSQLIFILLIIIIAFILLLVIVIIRNQKITNKFATELEKSNDLFSTLFNHNPAAISIKRISDGKIINVNNSFLHLYGFASKDDVINKTTVELNLFVDNAHTEELDNLLKENKIVRDLETNIKTVQGEIKWTSASVILIEIDDEPCLFAVSVDITHRKKAEEELLAVNKELESFTYSVSHDLRAPLRAINGYAKILEEDYGAVLDADGKSSLTAIMKNSKKMGDLIDDLLAFSRLGRKSVVPTEINMTGLVKSIREEEKLGQSNEIEFIVPELLPASGQQVLIKQVWVNLISNAIKYSRNKSKTIIEIGSYYKDNRVVYFIKDNGAGFDMQYYDKLFGVFQRLHSQDEFEGTGIGLAIVQKIIQRHSGTVWAEAKVNEGACFYFTLPIINF